MKKIIIAFDGTQFSEGAFETARQLNHLQPILLTGVFLPQVNFANLWSYGTAMSGTSLIPLIEEEESSIVQSNIKQFETLCQANKIQYKIHKDFFDFALPELKKESRFADALIISSEKFYENMLSNNTNEYLEDAVHHAECPVIVVPENFSFPTKNILAYDGSASSVYAIKLFTYLFPELCKNETLLLYVEGDKNERFPYEENIKELANQHYTKLQIEKLHLNSRKYFSNWLEQEGNSILVSGAFAKHSLFHKSFVSEAIGKHKLPVFIAHR